MGKKFLLDIKNISYVLNNNKKLIDNISFTLAEKSTLVIAGLNGCGKTTLLNLLCGLKKVSSGEILFDGININNFSHIEKAKKIAVVNQKEMPDENLYVKDYIRLGRLPLENQYSNFEHEQEVNRLIKLTGLEDHRNKKISMLSGGELQRAHVARALAQEPICLFLDEPTNNLDPKAKGEILSLVSSLDITTVMIIHDIVLIPEFSTDVALMKNSKLIKFGKTNNIINKTNIHQTFMVDYVDFDYAGRKLHALDIIKNNL